MVNLYLKNKQPEADETCGIEFIDVNDAKMKLNSDTPFWNNLTPAAKASLLLYFN